MFAKAWRGEEIVCNPKGHLGSSQRWRFLASERLLLHLSLPPLLLWVPALLEAMGAVSERGGRDCWHQQLQEQSAEVTKLRADLGGSLS